MELYGLRPAELAVLTAKDGKALVGHVKRNSTTMGAKAKPPRRVIPLDVPGLEGEGARLLALYESKQLKLPKSLRNQIAKVVEHNSFQGVGADFAQKLERYGPWRALVARCPGVMPYSLRHGYAWRAHKGSNNPIHPRDAAALMGHNVATHFKHYGSWTDKASLEAAVERFNQGVHVPA